MSTYLDLCKELRRECQLGGTGPASVLNQTGRLADLVAWARNAWTELQGESTSWRWLMSTFTVNTTVDVDTYAFADCTDDRTGSAIARFSHWRPFDTDGTPVMQSYLTAAGVSNRTFLAYLDWGQFRSVFRSAAVNSGPPIHFAIDPLNNLVLGPAPSDVYTITGDFQRSPQILAADDDVPEMPSQFHQLIVYLAMEKYGGSIVAGDILSRALREGGKLKRQLRANQLPKMNPPRPLA